VPATSSSRIVQFPRQRVLLRPEDRLLSERPPRLLFVTPELVDFVKVGGLGEVSGALPRALRQTNDIRLLLPGYRAVTQRRSLTAVAQLPAVAGMPAAEIGRIDMADGLIVYVLLCPELYEREGTPYGDGAGNDWADNDVRFGRFSLAAAEIAMGVAELGWKPDLLHANDWPAALAPGYLAWRGSNVPSVLTVHNLAYQGLFNRSRLPSLAIPEHAFGINGVEFHGMMSFLKAGLFYASQVTTVSATYAHEITTPEFGCGLEGLLRTRAERDELAGILNGIDDSWDASRDPELPSPFTRRQQAGKAASAHDARETFGLEVSRGPLFAIISRLVHQKGIDLAIQAADDLVAKGGQLAVMGTGEPELESALQSLAQRHPGRVGVRIGFDDADARRLYAGSDFLLMPSRFEPCGLSQMFAQRYASLPVAHRTGGLADTIEDGVTGFLFSDPSIAGLWDGILRALDSFGSRKRLNEMRARAMTRPLDWLQSGRRYNFLYDKLLRGAGADPHLDQRLAVG
jgi:starch synthase